MLLPVPHGVPVRRSATSDGTTWCCVSCRQGELSIWSSETMVSGETRSDLVLSLAPRKSIVVGRSSSGPIEYLEEGYRVTTIAPGSERSVLRHGGRDQDTLVSRAHFMLQRAGDGICLVNGVPSPDGGLRAPLNGTTLLHPVRRELRPGEHFLVLPPDPIELLLPNGAVLHVTAIDDRSVQRN